MPELQRVRVAEVEALQALGDDDRAAAVRREVEVVRIGDGPRAATTSGSRIDRRQRVALVAVDPERVQVPRRRDVLWLGRNAEAADDLERLRIDLVDRVALRLRDVDAIQRSARDRRDRGRRVCCVDVADGCRARAARGGIGQRQDAALRAARAIAPADDEDPAGQRRCAHVGERLREPPGPAGAPGLRVDRHDRPKL